MTPEKYIKHRNGYLEWYNLLGTKPEISGALQDVNTEVLESLRSRLDGFNFASEEFLKATSPFLKAENHALRAAALESLLFQIEGDLRAARFIWDVIQKREADQDVDLLVVTRELQKSRMLTEGNIPESIPPDLLRASQLYDPEIRPSRPHTMQLSLDNLRSEIDDTTTIVPRLVVRTSLDLVEDILRNHPQNKEQLAKGIDLLRGSQKLGSIAWGLEDSVGRENSSLARELRETLANIITRILMIVEKNELVRYTIADWLDDLSGVQPSDRRRTAAAVIEHLYQTRVFREKQLDAWLVAADSIASAHSAAIQVGALIHSMSRLDMQVRRIGRIARGSSLFDHALVASTGLALQVGLMGIVVFAGFDHLDEGTNTLNITRGIKEILITEFNIPRQLLHRLTRR